MGAPIDLRQRPDEVGLRHVADHQDVEEAVVGARLGAHLHPAPEVAAVGDDHLVHPSGALLAVDLHAHLRVLPPREHRERRPEVRRLPAECLRRLVRSLRDRAAHPDAGDVHEPGFAGLARPGPERDASRVDLPRRARGGPPGRPRRARSGCRTCARSRPRCRAGRRPARSPFPTRPEATSLTVPSPPTATTRPAPASAACRASSRRCPGRSEKSRPRRGPASPSGGRAPASGGRSPRSPKRG